MAATAFCHTTLRAFRLVLVKAWLTLNRLATWLRRVARNKSYLFIECCVVKYRFKEVLTLKRLSTNINSDVVIYLYVPRTVSRYEPPWYEHIFRIGQIKTYYLKREYSSKPTQKWAIVKKTTSKRAKGDTERGEQVTTTFYSLRKGGWPSPSGGSPEMKVCGVNGTDTHACETTNVVLT